MHPAEIAKELRTYPFFKSFSDDILFQICTLVQIKKVKENEEFLKEGEENKDLYFLRKGKVNITLGNEIISTLSSPGEVFGEMSVIGSSATSTSLVAVEDCELFTIHTPDFMHVNTRDQLRFEALLYKIYSSVLIDRLIKTNEKARLFEILNRELHEAQSALKKGFGGRVLLLESDKKQQVIVKMAVGGTGVDFSIASDIPTATDLLSKNKYDIIICEDSFVDLVIKEHAIHPQQVFVLMTTQDPIANLNTLKKLPFVEYVVSRDCEDRRSMIKMILITLQKILNKDLFGLEKYLSWGVEVVHKHVQNSSDRHRVKEEMCVDLKVRGVRGSVLDRCNTVAEELLMNAIYDAPTDVNGQVLFNHVSRKSEIKLESHQRPFLRYATDGSVLALSVTDPFGSLTKDVLQKYLLNCYTEDAGSINANEKEKGGAGRGLHQIVENSDLTVFNVKKGVRTEIVCLYFLDHQGNHYQSSFQYFFQ